MSIQNCVASVGAMGIQGIVNGYGTDAIAAYTAAGKIDQLAIMPLNSLGMAVSTLMSVKTTAKESEVREYIRALRRV